MLQPSFDLEFSVNRLSDALFWNSELRAIPIRGSQSNILQYSGDIQIIAGSTDALCECFIIVSVNEIERLMHRTMKRIA